ncbi:DUF983 domain-containing protein [Nonlabens ponticola]|uniref:DUF983 domain-containing protein n=1 Tax=Nonlabens ponticola TaxID=2496866 RepID=A0A3S9N0F4_9FLAO|nr:DUF983 domain-containing protein [Nonlabens ponticola]AZQ44802.1 DUF983 domain-containing protein [Nonlabens ponticola]
MATSKIVSLLFLKCPHCRKGNLLESHPYKISKFNKVNQHCPNCDFKLVIEPSFYYGSMYVSYGLGVAFAVATYVIMLLLDIASNPLYIFLAILVVLVVIWPYTGALAKSIWAHLFISYDKDAGLKSK